MNDQFTVDRTLWEKYNICEVWEKYNICEVWYWYRADLVGKYKGAISYILVHNKSIFDYILIYHRLYDTMKNVFHWLDKLKPNQLVDRGISKS